MNNDQVQNILQKAMAIVGTWLAAKGVSESNTELICGIATAVAGVVWSHFFNATPVSTVAAPTLIQPVKPAVTIPTTMGTPVTPVAPAVPTTPAKS